MTFASDEAHFEAVLAFLRSEPSFAFSNLLFVVDQIKRGHPAYRESRVLLDDVVNPSVVVCFFEEYIYSRPGFRALGIVSKDRAKLENVFREASSLIFPEDFFVMFAACFSSAIADTNLSLQAQGQSVKQLDSCILFYREVKDRDSRTRLVCPDGYRFRSATVNDAAYFDAKWPHRGEVAFTQLAKEQYSNCFNHMPSVIVTTRDKKGDEVVIGCCMQD